MCFFRQRWILIIGFRGCLPFGIKTATQCSLCQIWRSSITTNIVIRGIFILKSRQLGFSTYKCIDALNYIMTHPGHNALIIAHTAEAASALFQQKVQQAWEALPEWEKDEFNVKSLTSGRIQLEWHDGRQSTLQIGTSARSGTYQYIHITELSYLDKHMSHRSQEIISGALPAISHGGQLDIESTARGNTGIFYDTFMQAYKSGKPQSKKEFQAHFYSWRWDEYELSKITEALVTHAKSEMGKQFLEYQKTHQLTDREITFYYLQFLSFGRDFDMLRQEYPTTVEEAFMRPDDQFFCPQSIHNQTPKEPIKRDGDWYIFAEYSADGRYAMGVDVAEGIGRDSSTGVIWNFSTREIVATYANNNTPPDDLAYEMTRMGKVYGQCLIAVERNNHGHTTLSHLRNNYPVHKIYQETRTDKTTEEKTQRLGWHTNASTKPKMFYELATALRETDEQKIQLNDARIIQKAKNFSKQDTRSNTNSTRHWDLLTAAAIGYQMQEKSMPPVIEADFMKLHTL